MIQTSIQFIRIDWLLLAAFLIAAASVVVFLRSRNRPLFAYFRIPVILFLLVLSSSPVIVRSKGESKPVVAVMIDTSPSMALTKRSESAVNFINKYENALNSKVELKYYGFASASGEVRSPSAALKGKFGANTDLNNALWEIRRENGDNLAGILLISDGNHNAGTLKDNWLDNFDAPVFTVAAGSGKKVKDIAVASVKVSDFAFKNVPLDIVAVVSASSLAGRSTSVRIKGGVNNSEILAAKPFNIASDNETQEISLRLTPAANGNFTYTVEAVPVEGEVSTANNSKTLSLNVIRDKLRVLFLAGRPTFEYAFLRHLLKNDPMVELVSFVILRNPENIMLVSDDNSSLIPFPAHDLFSRDLYNFDLLILDNFSFQKIGISPQYFSNIRDWVVNKGGALLMKAGNNSFGSGGWNLTAVEELLPVSSKLTGDDFDESIFRPKALNTGHYILTLSDNKKENEALWKSIPELDGSQLLQAKPGAETLLVNPRNDSAVLSAWDRGQGRVGAIGVNNTWRWALQSGTLNIYNAFWKNLTRYLTRSGKADEWQAAFDKSEYFAGQSYSLKLRRPYEAGASKLWLKIIGPDGGITTSPLKKTGGKEWSYSSAFPKTGLYRFELNSESPEGGGGVIYRFEASAGASTAKEEANLNNDEEMLKNIASATDGLAFDEFDFSLTDFYGKLKAVNKKSVLEKLPLGTSVWWLAVLVILLVAEWYLRRKKGMW